MTPFRFIIRNKDVIERAFSSKYIKHAYKVCVHSRKCFVVKSIDIFVKVL
jgi:hypothetical protein